MKSSTSKALAGATPASALVGFLLLMSGFLSIPLATEGTSMVYVSAGVMIIGLFMQIAFTWKFLQEDANSGQSERTHIRSVNLVLPSDITASYAT